MTEEEATPTNTPLKMSNSKKIEKSRPASIAIDMKDISMKSLDSKQPPPVTPLVLLVSSTPKMTSTPMATMCRICHSGENSLLSIEGSEEKRVESLISPCLCSGSVAAVHKTCLEKWLSIKEDVEDWRCELCGFKYVVSTKTRSTKLFLAENRRAIVGDAFCCVFLTPLAGFSCYLFFLGMVTFLSGSRIEAFSLLFLAGFLIIVYGIWLGVTAKFHAIELTEWRQRNKDIRLVQSI